MKKIIVCLSCGAINKAQLSDIDSKTPVCGKCSNELNQISDVKTLTTQKLDKVIQHSELPVVVDIYADWCGPCQAYAPIFKEVASKNWQRAEFFKIDSQADPNFSARYNVRGIPTTLIFKNGRLVNQQSGLLNHSQLESLI